MSPQGEFSKIDIVIPSQEKSTSNTSKNISLNSFSQEKNIEIKESHEPPNIHEMIKTSSNSSTSSKRSTISSKNRSTIGAIRATTRVILKVCDLSIKKLSVTDSIQLSSLVCLCGLLIASLTINKLKNSEIWEVALWRFVVLLLVIFSGNFTSIMLTKLITFLIQKANGYIKSKVLYFIYVLMSSSAVMMWLVIIIIVWIVLIREQVEISLLSTSNDKKVVRKITRGMASTLAGVGMWVMKTYLIKYISSSFQMKKFYGRVRDAIYYKYVVQELEKIESGAILLDDEEQINCGGEIEYEWKYVEILNETKQDDVSATYMTQLIERLNVMDLLEIKKFEFEDKSKSRAQRILQKIGKHHNQGYIERGKFKVLPEKASERVLQLFKGTAEDQQEDAEPSPTLPTEIKIKKTDFQNWMMDADKELRNLASSLNDSKSAIDELNVIVSVVVLVGIVVVWLLLMGITTTEILVLISSQLLVWSFIFGDTFKTILDGVIFNFVSHPFDVGDECQIEGEKMIVEEMGLLSTEFEGIIKENDDKKNNGKIHYSNSVLNGIRIINYTKTSSKEEVSRIWK